MRPAKLTWFTRASVMAVLAAAIAVVLGGCATSMAPPASGTTSSGGVQVPSTPATPTPSSAETDVATPGVTEGPYFKAGSPATTTLALPGTNGTVLTLTGHVFDASGQPIPNARVDFWQADETGAYDNNSYRYRGYQLTTADGSYTLVTVVPGLYPGRTRHIHVKVQPPGASTLTTQLFIPNEPGNSTDSIYDPRLLITNYHVSGKTATGTFDFVVAR